MGAVRFELIGKVDGVPRVVVEHITRTDAESDPDWENPPAGHDGCYRIKITGEPMMQVDFTHHGEHGDHNVSRHDHHRPADHQRRCPRSSPPSRGLVTAIDLPLVTGRGLVSTSEHPRQLRRHRPGRDRHRRGPRARRRHRRRARRGGRRRPHLGAHRRPARPRSPSRIEAAGRRAVVVPADLSDLDAVAGLAQTAYDELGRLDTVVNNVGGTFPRGVPRDQPAVPHRGVQLQRRHRARADPRRRAADARRSARRTQKSVVTISSMMGRTADRGFVAYGTAKAALAHWTRLAALRPGAADPGQRHLRRLDHDQRPGVRRRPARDDEPDGDQDPARQGRRPRGHRGGRALPQLRGRASTSPASCSRSTAASSSPTSTWACPRRGLTVGSAR